MNVTYERYVFNRRVQESGERFDVFLGDVRRLARSCDFTAVEESMIRDRIVVGIRDDSTRHKLLQIRDLTLVKAIDICKASEAAGKQMKAIAGSDQVQSLRSVRKPETCDRLRDKSCVRRSRDDSREPVRAKSPARRCKYCDRKHELLKEACPAYGKVCRRCSRKNHFESVCQSKATGNRNVRHNVHETDADEQLLTLGDEDTDRWYTRLKIGDKTVRFLLDCGATVNLIPEALVRSLGLNDIRPATAKLRMFDKSELLTRGRIMIAVEHPRTSRVYELEFYVAAKHEQPLLGFKACRLLKLLRVVEENICEVRTTAESKACITEVEIVDEYADTLSRAYPPADLSDKHLGTRFTEELAELVDDEQLQDLRMVASQRTIDALRVAAIEDEEYSLLIQQIAVGWPTTSADLPTELRPYATFSDELIVSGGLVYKGHRVVIPRGARDDILHRLHASHIGINGCIRRARDTVFFPGITTAIKELVSKCQICAQYQNEIQKEPLMTHPAPSRPWEKVGSDIFTFHGQDYLITVDYLSGYFEVDRLPSRENSRCYLRAPPAVRSTRYSARGRIG